MFRHHLSAFLAIPLIAASSHAQGTLSSGAAKAGINFGMATSSRQLTGTYGTTVKTHYNMLVAENDMKFQSTEPSRGKFSYTGGDGLYTYGQANGQRLRGHNFCWHAQSGFAATLNGTRDVMLSVMRTHIDSVGGHFKGKVVEWDVLNEITDDGNGNALRASFWQKAIGNDYVDSAFVISRRADPYAKLYYNEYGAEGSGGKSDAVYKLAQKLVAAKIPIDGIGLQCHLSSGLNAKAISTNIKRLGELGLRVSMTEIDIKNGTTADWTNLLGACLENFNCVSFLTWGVYDGSSWLGQGCKCLPFDEQWAAKPAVQAMIDLMNNADPAIIAKRKEFAKEPILPTLIYPHKALARGRAGALLPSAAVPVFSSGAGVIDALGRNRSIAPHSPWAAGLVIAPD
jgi:endo-1,4-beta-xylanase